MEFIVWLFCIERAIDFAMILGYVFYKRKRAIVKGIVAHPQLPFIDKRFKKMAGNPNKTQVFAAQRLTMVVRYVVNLQAFEYLIQGIVNSKSPLRKSMVERNKS